jgi:hypothetical protein
MKFIGRQLLCGYFSQELCTDPKEWHSSEP